MTMDILLFIRFFAFLVYCYLTVFVLWKDPKSILNRVCAAFLASLAMWVFADFFVLDINTSKDTALLLTNISAIGWCSFSSFLFWLSLIFSEKKKILRTKFIYPLIFIPPALFISMQWAGSLLRILNKESYGWSVNWSDSIWSYLFFIYYLSFIIASLYLILDFKKKTKELNQKKQAGIIFTSVLISLILGSLTDVLLPNLNIKSIPPMANLFTLVWAAGLVYAIDRYKLMTITPAVAAEKIISTMADSLVLLDKQGEIVFVNKSLIDSSGYHKNELKKKSIDILFKEKDFKGILLNKAAKGEDIRNSELNIETKNGIRIPVLFSSSNVKDNAGGLAGIVCIAKDITERKKTEMDLKIQNEEVLQQSEELTAQAEEIHVHVENLREANELLIDEQRVIEMQSKQLKEVNEQLTILNTTKDKFFSIIAHDLKNPFNSILGFSEMLYFKYEKLSEDKKHKYIEAIHLSSKKVFELLENLLQWARTQTKNIAFHPEEFELKEVVVSNIELMKELLEKKQIIINNNLPEDIKIYADQNMIKTVIRNLLSNSIKFTEKGKITIDLSVNSDFCKVMISDTGIGIPDSELESIFEIGYSKSTPGTHDESGTGLGLIICKEFVEKNGGSIGVESVIDKGSRFYFTLPLATE